MKVIVVGAGMAGLSLANRVSTLGGEVVLLERATGPRAQGYMMDFFGPGYDAIEAMGLLPAVEDVAYHIAEATFVDEHGRRRAGVRPRQFANGPLLNLMRPDLERVLREHLPPEVDLRFGTGPTAVTDHNDGVRVTLADGTRLDADMLVGADGIHSTVRHLVFGREAEFLRYLGFHTAAFCFDAPEVEAIVRDRACLTDTVGRQMGFYSLRDGRVAAFGVHRTADPTLPEDLRTAVRDAFAGLGWVAPRALDRCPAIGDLLRPGRPDRDAPLEQRKGRAGRRRLLCRVAARRTRCVPKHRGRVPAGRSTGPRPDHRAGRGRVRAVVAPCGAGEAAGGSHRRSMVPPRVAMAAPVPASGAAAGAATRARPLPGRAPGGQVQRPRQEPAARRRPVRADRWAPSYAQVKSAAPCEPDSG